jgi:hypothetical protein
VHKPELIPSRIVNQQSPQLVIKFYEDRLTWNTINGKNETTNTNDNSDNNNSQA